MKPSQNSLFKADTRVRSVAENGILGLVHDSQDYPVFGLRPLGYCKRYSWGKIVAMRWVLGISQNALAQRLDLDPTTLSRWSGKGRPVKEHLEKLAALFQSLLQIH
jgi:hypothetical protein